MQDKFHVKVDLPFVLYFAFETTAPTDICFDPEQKKMFVVYNVLIVAFHPALNIKRIITQKSYAHSLEQLTSLNFFSEDQMKFIDFEIIKQLKMLQLMLVKEDVKIQWVKKYNGFNKKYRTQYLEVNAFVKMQYERNNPVNWKNDKCALCKLQVRVDQQVLKRQIMK